MGFGKLSIIDTLQDWSVLFFMFQNHHPSDYTHHFNPFWSVINFLILLWPVPDDFTHQGGTSCAGKG